MSEVERLSNSGLYPMLPIADQGAGGGQSGARRDPRERAAPREPRAEDKPAPAPEAGTPAKTLIDEYA